MRTIYDDIYEHIELLRNGAIVSSDDPVVNLFRQRCLEQAFFRFTTDLLPKLLAADVIKDSEQLKLLCKLTGIEDKFEICARLSPCPRYGVN